MAAKFAAISVSSVSNGALLLKWTNFRIDHQMSSSIFMSCTSSCQRGLIFVCDCPWKTRPALYRHMCFQCVSETSLKSIQLSHTYITLHVPSPWHLWAIQGETWSCGCRFRSTPGRNPLPTSAASRPSLGAGPSLERAPWVYSVGILDSITRYFSANHLDT